MTKLEKSDPDSSSARYLVYAISLLCVIGFILTLLRLLLPLLQVLIPATIGWWLWRHWQKRLKKQQERLDGAFYEFLKAHQGQVTVLDFAMTVNLSASAAREYLDAKAKDFVAHFEVTERGDIYYLFPTLESPQFQGERSPISPRQFQTPPCPPVPKSLTQAQLARRLGVSAAAIRRRKHASGLAEWSKSRDPDGVRWAYVDQAQRFVPLQE